MKTEWSSIKILKNDIRRTGIISEIKCYPDGYWSFASGPGIQLQLIKHSIVGEVNNNTAARTASLTQ